MATRARASKARPKARASKARPKARASKARPKPPPAEPDCLSPELVAQLVGAAQAKGVSIETLIRVAMHNISTHAGIYALDTRMGFGKYTTETVEAVIRCDPAYAVWARASVDRFQLSEE